jgi:hypothetical protein
MNNLEKAFALFDAFNKQDPNEINFKGNTYPLEYFFALRLYEWVRKLEPAAGEPLLLASRSQHIGRWLSARSSYPEGKAGYLQWRQDLAKFHALKSAELMREAGYDEETIAKVEPIILKKDLQKNPEVQTIENALCLVFLEYQYEDFLHKHEEPKIIRILQKSWKKMTEPGRNAALTIGYSEKGKELISKALG